jgi:hypothetical protein
LKGRWSLLALAALLLLCAGVAQTSPGHSVLTGLGLSATPPSYTELAFTNPGDLQETDASVQAPVTVDFSIHNVSASARHYQWTIVALHNGANVGSLSGDVTVAAQAKTAFSENVQVTCPSGRDQMVLRLASPAESLNFWVTCPSGGGDISVIPAGKKAGQ